MILRQVVGVVRKVRERIQQADGEECVCQPGMTVAGISADALADVDDRAVDEEVEAPHQGAGRLPLHLEILHRVSEEAGQQIEVLLHKRDDEEEHANAPHRQVERPLEEVGARHTEEVPNKADPSEQDEDAEDRVEPDVLAAGTDTHRERHQNSQTGDRPRSHLDAQAPAIAGRRHASVILKPAMHHGHAAEEDPRRREGCVNGPKLTQVESDRLERWGERGHRVQSAQNTTQQGDSHRDQATADEHERRELTNRIGLVERTPGPPFGRHRYSHHGSLDQSSLLPDWRRAVSDRSASRSLLSHRKYSITCWRWA